MQPQLDRIVIPSRNRLQGAKLLAELLGVSWSTAGVGQFASVFVNDNLKLDFAEWPEPLPELHYSFRVDDPGFDAILRRLVAAHIAFRSSPQGAADRRIATEHGGRIVYWREPEGHQWQVSTVSYARPG
jgi:hypothetical protein